MHRNSQPNKYSRGTQQQRHTAENTPPAALTKTLHQPRPDVGQDLCKVPNGTFGGSSCSCLLFWQNSTRRVDASFVCCGTGQPGELSKISAPTSIDICKRHVSNGQRRELGVSDQGSKQAGLAGSTPSPNAVVTSIPPSDRNDFRIFLRNCI